MENNCNSVALHEKARTFLFPLLKKLHDKLDDLTENNIVWCYEGHEFHSMTSNNDSVTKIIIELVWDRGEIVSGSVFDFHKDIYSFEGTFHDNGAFKNGTETFYRVESSFSYTGNFNKSNKYHGTGKSTLKKKNNMIITYEGSYKDGFKHGHGIMTKSNGESYEGQYKYGLFNGYGKKKNYSELYEGNFKDGRKHGKGILRKNGDFHFTGTFVDGKKQGHGVLLKTNGEKYIGHFKDDKYHGHGFFQFRTGSSYDGNFVEGIIKGKGTMFRMNNRLWKKGEFENNQLHGKGIVYKSNGTIETEGKFVHGNFFDEPALMIQKFLDTRDALVLKKITAKEIQRYIEKKYEKFFPDTKKKQYLINQLIELSKPSNTDTSVEEENYDEFGNEIRTQCLGNDGNIYDIESMFYLFQQNEQGEYVNIPYHYVNNVRTPNFPRMGNGKLLDGYEIRFVNITPPILSRCCSLSNMELLSDENLFDDEEMTEL